MKNAFRRLRGVLGMGVIWALGWAVIGGGIMEGIVDPDGKILDMWPQTLAIPGFLGGIVFSLMLWLMEGRRRFDELSLPRFTAWGAAAGVLLGAFAIATGAAHNLFPVWYRALVLIAPAVALGAVSASGTLSLARFAERRELLGTPTRKSDDLLSDGDHGNR